jgi:competence protein ComEA
MLSWLERSRWPLLGLAALFLSISIGVLIDRQFFQSPRPLEIRLDDTPAAEIQVYVAGAVVQPGVYYLNDGDRWIDALEAAGGPAVEADLESVNLSRRLLDEDQVMIPRLAEATAVPDGPAPVAATPVGVLGASQAPADERIDINTADAALLETLPGIGSARAGRIVESRQADGPFARSEELVERGLIPQSVFQQILGLITLGP